MKAARRALPLLAVLLAIGAGACANETHTVPAMPRPDEPVEGFDAHSPGEARIGATPADVMRMLAEDGKPSPTEHALTPEERRKLAAAFGALTPLHRRVLRERLHSISFLDGMPNNALTSPADANEPHRLFHITFRAGILRENLSEFLTQKERQCFDTAGSSRSVSIEAGTMDAIVYVLLHEATHVVDGGLRLTPGSAFTKSAWSDRTLIAPAFRDPLLARVKFRREGEVLPIDRAEAVYAALQRTPFVSLYASSNWSDDLAEAVAWYHLTERLGQPYRIVIRDQGNQVFAYEPMKSPVVRNRFDALSKFYEEPG
ncbi:hypothetical protein LVJ94_21370 [Pendulispora rubella]|uniref:Secreted protein n=1 Tax=Pendulispora rubella TaxID=2741070 RepID=A0ABZ2LG97_9BACT